MKGIRRNWLLVPAVISAMALAAPSLAQTTASTERPAGPAAKPKGSQAAPKRAQSSQANGHVYLLRGLLNIFSLGMDDLAAKIQARGISASVHNHSEWQGIADDIAAKYKARAHGPVVLVGHSLGADAVMFMAEHLGKKGVPVALVVPFDGTGSFAASSNVSQVYNLTQRDYAHMRKGAGFRGQLNNVDVSGPGYGHIDIDKSARLHALVLARIQTVIRARGGTRTADDVAPAPRARATAPAAEPGAPAAPAPQAAPAAKPSADAASVAPAPATTASTNASAAASVERAASAPPAVTRPASVSTESSVKRQPAGSESGAKPALRF
jgi:pimeloyl-ACP methyl ester carboxylesterase